MASQAVAGAPLATFQPSAWLSAFEAIGGDWALTGRTLHLFVDHCADADLATVMRHIRGRPERQEAIKAAIQARQLGQAA